MKTHIFLFTLFCLTAALTVSAQVKTVTNTDLEKFRQQRLQQERDYRENYARRGMLSPEEIDQVLAERRARLETLSDKFRAERLATEQLQTELNIAQQQAAIVYGSEPNYYAPLYDGGFFGDGFGFPLRHNRRSQQGRVFTDHFAGGQFWQAPPRAVFPAFRTGGRSRGHR
jgi:cell division protein FtsL